MEEFIKIIKHTCNSSSKVNEHFGSTYTVSIWKNILDDYPSTCCFSALRNFIKKSKYVPHISEIVKEIEEITPKYGIPNQEDMDRMTKILIKTKSQKLLPENEPLNLLSEKSADIES